MGFLFRLVFHILISAAILWVIDMYIFSDSFAITGEGFGKYALVAFLFGILNITVKPILKLFLLPVQIITLGLVGLLVNGILLAIIAFLLNSVGIGDTTIFVESWITYIWVGIVISLANMVVHWFT
ncbi:phage holin family protein [bacterium]|nr:phage holin family protein [bacterium]NCQ55254.1 phage holin family protein [Candidatus Parcubacteria bacterium]NCS67233.1 phage holin family protein [Candidatus Peregrinibacteria bacterium]NCS96488.1 phage holin family protein [bacterium]